VSPTISSSETETVREDPIQVEEEGEGKGRGGGPAANGGVGKAGTNSSVNYSPS